MLMRGLKATILVLLLCTAHDAWARCEPIGFFLDEQGEMRQLNLLTRVNFTLGKGFPYYHSPVGLSITTMDSGKEIARIDKDNGQVFWSNHFALPYPLDSHRIVVGSWVETAIWDLRGDSLRTFPEIRNPSWSSMSGIHPDEQAALSSGERADGVTFHDLRGGARAKYYEGYTAYSPRFSPDGTRWAFFGKSGFDHLALIIRWTQESRERIVPLARELVHGGHVLAWSPTGERIASVLGSSQLVIWDSEGNQLHRIKLPFRASWYWAPVWNKDETGVYILPKPDIDAIPYRYKNPLKPEFVSLPNSKLEHFNDF